MKSTVIAVASVLLGILLAAIVIGILFTASFAFAQDAAPSAAVGGLVFGDFISAFAQVPAVAFIAYLAYRMTTVTVPKLAEDFQSSLKNQFEAFRETLEAQRKDFQAAQEAQVERHEQAIEREREFHKREIETILEVLKQ